MTPRHQKVVQSAVFCVHAQGAAVAVVFNKNPKWAISTPDHMGTNAAVIIVLYALRLYQVSEC